MKPRLTSKQRRIAALRTKRYAPYVLWEELREYAQARRARASRLDGDYSWDHSDHREQHQHSHVLGAMAALSGVGLITDAQFDRSMARLERISKAKITRRPFAELRRVA